MKKVGGMVGRLGGTLVITFDIIESDMKKKLLLRFWLEVLESKYVYILIERSFQIHTTQENAVFPQSDSTTIGTDSKAVEKKCLPLQFC